MSTLRAKVFERRWSILEGVVLVVGAIAVFTFLCVHNTFVAGSGAALVLECCKFICAVTLLWGLAILGSILLPEQDEDRP